MAQQAHSQLAETLEQRSLSPYVRAGRELLQELGSLASPHDTTLLNPDSPGIGTEATANVLSIDRSDGIGVITTETNKITIDALAKTRFFAQEAVDRVRKGWEIIRNNPKELLKIGSVGTAAAVSLPVVSAAAEKVAPIVRSLDMTQDAKAALQGEIPNVPSFESGEDQGDDGYPYANSPPGTTDEMGYRYDQCTGYVRWRKQQDGVSSDRLVLSYDLESYRKRGEVVDKNPAVGAVAILPPASEGEAGHMMVVVAHDNETGDVWVKEWNVRGNKFSLRKANVNDHTLRGAGNLDYVHFELPAPPVENPPEDIENPEEEEIKPAERFMGARYDKRSKNTIRLRQPIKKGTFIQSESGQYRLVFDGSGTGAKLWDAKSYKVKWQKFLGSKKAQFLQIKPDKKTNSTTGRASKVRQNVLTLGTSKEDFVRIPIGNATRVVLEDDGTFSGYRGNSKTPVWKGASNPARIATIARSAARKASRTSARINSTKSSKTKMTLAK